MSATADALPPSQREAYERAVAAAGRLLAASDGSAGPAYVPGGPSALEIAAASQRLRKQAAGKPAA